MGRAEKNLYFQKKKRNIDVILGGKKNCCLQTKMEGRKKIKNWCPPKKNGAAIFFSNKKFYHGKIEAANPSSIKLIFAVA